MSTDGQVAIDLVIFGGGAAGLWLLDLLQQDERMRSAGAILLEANELGSGQTIASQGIIHGGLKYTLSGLLTPAAQSIREMPELWRRCLAGEARPDLSTCRLRAEYCHLWRTRSLSSKLAMIGARAGLRVKPALLGPAERPAVLANVPGTVARLDEQVIEPASLLEVLSARNRQRLIKVDISSGLEFSTKHGRIELVRLINPATGQPLDIRARMVVFIAGAGNEVLRSNAGLAPGAMQRRPLHMVMARGSLPELNGHCVDRARTRLTITSTTDLTGQRIWQIGGQVAEDGIDMQPAALLEHARKEIADAIPGFRSGGIAWATYRVDRAEAASGGARPQSASVVRDGNIITAWPTKLALVPHLAQQVLAAAADVATDSTRDAVKGDAIDVQAAIADWPRPDVALPPWEQEKQWFTDL